MLQCIDRLSTHINDVVPTQSMRDNYVKSRIEVRASKNILNHKLDKGKSATPIG